MVGLYLVTMFGLIHLVYGTREVDGPPAFLFIVTLVCLLGCAKLLSLVHSYLGLDFVNDNLFRNWPTNDPWRALPDPSSTFWAREDDVTKVGQFFILAFPPLIIIGGAAYHFGFFG